MGEGVLKRVLHRLATDEREMHAEDVRDTVRDVGATPVRQCTLGQRVSVAGTLAAVTLRPRAGVPALEAELWDGDGTVTLIWLGRRRIPGVNCGRELVAHGRITQTDGRRTIFNPVYELLPPDAG